MTSISRSLLADGQCRELMCFAPRSLLGFGLQISPVIGRPANTAAAGGASCVAPRYILREKGVAPPATCTALARVTAEDPGIVAVPAACTPGPLLICCSVSACLRHSREETSGHTQLETRFQSTTFSMAAMSITGYDACADISTYMSCCCRIWRVFIFVEVCRPLSW